MSDRLTVAHVVRCTAIATGFSVERILSRERSPKMMDTRRALVFACYQLGFPTGRISRGVKRHHSTVHNYIHGKRCLKGHAERIARVNDLSSAIEELALDNDKFQVKRRELMERIYAAAP